MGNYFRAFMAAGSMLLASSADAKSPYPIAGLDSLVQHLGTLTPQSYSSSLNEQEFMFRSKFIPKFVYTGPLPFQLNPKVENTKADIAITLEDYAPFAEADNFKMGKEDILTIKVRQEDGITYTIKDHGVDGPTAKDYIKLNKDELAMAAGAFNIYQFFVDGINQRIK